MAEDQKPVETQDIASLQAELKKLQAEKSKAEAEKAALLESNTELQQQLEESQQTVEQVIEIVTDGKNKYQLLGRKVQLDGKAYSFEDLKKDKEAVAKLVERSSGFLKKL